jgi:hypothetical protein
VNVDTGQFAAIRDQLDDIDTEMGEHGDRMAELTRMVSTILRELVPAVQHAANLRRQPSASARHRAAPGRHRHNRLPRYCGDRRADR